MAELFFNTPIWIIYNRGCMYILDEVYLTATDIENL